MPASTNHNDEQKHRWADEMLDRLAAAVVDLRATASNLLRVAERHQDNHEATQHNFELMQKELQEFRQRHEASDRRFEILLQEYRQLKIDSEKRFEEFRIESERRFQVLLEQLDRRSNDNL
jgi:hypothetical protein